MLKYSTSVLEINLSNLVKNYCIVNAMLEEGAECSAVVKADAYSLGYKQVTQKLISQNCRSFFVASIDEAIDFRKHFKDVNLYIFHGITDEECAQIANKNDVIPVLNDLYQIHIWNTLAKKTDTRLPAILKFDMGITRLGIDKADILKVNTERLLSNIDIKYIMGHLSCADQYDHSANLEQLKNMKNVANIFKNCKVSFANSSGIFLGPQYHFNLVRPGGALYGINPTPHLVSPMHHIVTLKAGILQKRILESDQNIGYGQIYKAKKGDKLLTIECGYADGLHRNLSNKGVGYAHEKYLPLVGRISMDLAVVNASLLTEYEFNNIKYVELLGDNITIDEVANTANTISYEILTSLKNRFNRIYKD